MARIRSLKPEIASDAKLSTVSRDARLTFVLMITQADDIGLLGGAHRQLLGALYPMDDSVTVAMLLGWIEELVTIGLVRWRATRDGVPVLQVTNWSKHQRVDNAGRSQLGALLAASPEDCTSFAESRGDSPQDAEVRGLDHRPPIVDRGPEITMQLVVALAREANRGLAEHPLRPQLIPPILPTSAKTRAAVETILAYGVLPDFAISALYGLAKAHTSERAVQSLGYFTAAVIRRWDEHQASAAVKGSTAPALLPTNPRQAPRGNKLEIGRANIESAINRRERERAAAGGSHGE